MQYADFKSLTGQIATARITMYLSYPAPSGSGMVFFEPDQLEEVLQDRDAFIAKHFGVMKDHYLRWVEFISNPQCRAKTRKGRQCRSSYSGCEQEFSTPDKFDSNRDYFCHSHQEYSEPVRKRV